MYRWHVERNLMLRRWRQELAKHGSGHPHSGWREYGHDVLAPPSLCDTVSCHCAAGKGTMRKRTLSGHSKACWFCNYEKYLPKKRGPVKRAAIAFEYEAEGQ